MNWIDYVILSGLGGAVMLLALAVWQSWKSINAVQDSLATIEAKLMDGDTTLRMTNYYPDNMSDALDGEAPRESA